MNFTANRSQLNLAVTSATMTLGHHIENAARAIVYARQANRDQARWYARQARADLAWYLGLRAIHNRPPMGARREA